MEHLAFPSLPPMSIVAGGMFVLLWTEGAFLWSWNPLLSHRFRSGASGDEAFQDAMLADFKAFNCDRDGRLSKVPKMKIGVEDSWRLVKSLRICGRKVEPDNFRLSRQKFVRFPVKPSPPMGPFFSTGQFSPPPIVLSSNS